jgi:hypothetical protein
MMFGHPQLVYMQRPEHFGASYDRGGERFGREGGKMLAELLRRRQAGSMGGQHPGFEGMGGHQSPFLGRHGMSPMMGAHPRYGFATPMGMAPGMGMGPGMGTAHMGMGMNPHMSFGLGRPPLSPSPYGRQIPSPFGYGSPGPPRAHAFAPQRRRAHSPFSRSGRSHFAAHRMYDCYDEDDEYEEEYRIPPPGHNVGSRVRGQPCRYMAPPSRRRRHPRRMFEESEDEYDDCDDYEGDFDDEDGFESLLSRQSPRMRLRGGF